ncbi:MAG: PQQ-dependent dehydrogenase, methanol/ethanol family [Gammaproteobacteria bacterium]|nr:PQQ-dependent dehydrogenase, methanol/ethanol family [Gammaproteobacteria bacterium]
MANRYIAFLACVAYAFLPLEFGLAAEKEVAAKAFGNVTQARVLGEVDSGENWLVNGGRFTGEHFSPLDEINDGNAEELGLAWFADIPSFTLSAEPLVIDGVAYLTGSLNHVYAIDAATGEMLWQFVPELRLDHGFGNSYSARANRGVAVWNGMVYTGTADCRLIAIDAANGKQLWEAPVCDPTEGSSAGITAAPRVGDGKVFMGYAGSDFGVRGSLTAFDAGTGAELWRFWTVPGDPARGFESKELEMASQTWAGGGVEQGGGAVWESIRYDPVTGLVIFGTASALPLNVRMRGPGDALFTCSVVAVDAETGTYRWHYQTVPEDAWDYDATMPKIVTDLEFGGINRRVVLEAGKSGFFYVIDARTGELLAADPIGTVTWASHIDIESGRPVTLPGARYYETDDPDKVTRVWPSVAGVRNWHPMSYSPKTGLVYMPITDMPSNYAPSGFFGARAETLGYGPDEEVPAGSGRLVAWDPVQRTTLWRVDHTIPWNSGVLSTAGNLIFQGTATGEFRAYHAGTGEVLWSSGKTGSSIQAAPVSYRLGGEQYVLVGAGRGGVLGVATPVRSQAPDARGPARLFAFKLGGKATIEASAAEPEPVPQPRARTASAEQVDRGDVLFAEQGCELCHGAYAMGSRTRSNENGAVPDLRYLPGDAHALWHGIVVGGSLRQGGMPGFGPDLSIADSEALRAFVIEQAWKLYEQVPGGQRIPSDAD